jgi:hypothetical protein
MKKKTILITALLASWLVSAQGNQISPVSEAEQIREEIQRHELVISALKHRLLTLENEEPVNIGAQIKITPDGMWFKNQIVSSEELDTQLQELPKDTSIRIMVDSSVSHKEVHGALNSCAKAGLAHVLFTTTKADQGGMRQ